ncbi:SDR family NAD(P)-dependent oxidoreductase [bacterium]|nr:SDR family NAD(P)-dependent oxidoreductase [bacterium]
MVHSYSQSEIAVIGLGCVLPDAFDVPTLWHNIEIGKYSIKEIPPDEWSIAEYYDPDPKLPDKTYCKLGAFIRDFEFNSLDFRIPPRIAQAMDKVQKWSLVATKEALRSAGYDRKPFDRENTAVILGNSMGGQLRVVTAMRVFFPEVVRALVRVPEFRGLNEPQKQLFLTHLAELYQDQFPEITEDTMPGELANIISGRVANVFDLKGSNYVTDAACASSLAATQSAIYGLQAGDFNLAVAGGADRSMGPDTFVKFSKIGALSGLSSCPFDTAAAGFVMGEGAVVFLLKRLEDAIRDGDQVLAVIKSIGSSSDGKGKGITAPNVKGQAIALERAYVKAGIDPASIGLIEAHGTSTIMGDQAEIQALRQVFSDPAIPRGSIPIGSIKSQIGHLKSAAGAAGLLKAVLSLVHRKIPPTINIQQVNPKLEIEQSPFFVNTKLYDWETKPNKPRRVGLSSFGFGGTNFHVILEEYQPGQTSTHKPGRVSMVKSNNRLEPPYPIVTIGASDRQGLIDRLEKVIRGGMPLTLSPQRHELEQPIRLAISCQDEADCRSKAPKILQGLKSANTAVLTMLANQGVFLGEGRPGQVAFLFPGQGSQYINMGRALRDKYSVVREVFDRADQVMLPRLGQSLSSYIFPAEQGPDGLKKAEEQLKHTRITQPAVLAMDLAIFLLLSEFAIQPDMVIGHSLGEYGALVAARVLTFGDSLIAASARAREMSDLKIEDCGKMASVFADISQIKPVLEQCQGYVIAANINSPTQTVIAGATHTVEHAVELFERMDIKTVLLPVSHAFHTDIVAPAAPRLRALLETMDIQSPHIPIISNVTGEFYPMQAETRTTVIDLLEQQVKSAVLFWKGIETLYTAGTRIFVEVGAKKALSGMVTDILQDRPHVAMYANHPKKEELLCFNDLLAAIYAQGVGLTGLEATAAPMSSAYHHQPERSAAHDQTIQRHEPALEDRDLVPQSDQGENDFMSTSNEMDRRYYELGRAIGRFLEILPEQKGPGQTPVQTASTQQTVPLRTAENFDQPLLVSGISLGLPGRNRPLFDSNNFNDMLRGTNFIEVLSEEDRIKMARKGITRLIKRSDGDPTLEVLTSPDDMVHLAAIRGPFNLVDEFGVEQDLAEAMNISTQMSVAAGILALKDAGIPLVLHYRTTTTGKQMPSHWALPEELRDGTGVICASAFASGEAWINELTGYFRAENRFSILRKLDKYWESMPREWQSAPLGQNIREWLADLRQTEPHRFSRKFIFQVLPMGASQLAQYIGARGPNTHMNSACASTSVAIGIAHDWIKANRCRRVIVVAGDDVTNDTFREWILSGLFALGAATAAKTVEGAALPFDRRRSGMIAGMGAIGMIIERPEDVQQRGMRGLAELLGIDYRNSAFHASKLDIEHIKWAMEQFISRMEREYGLDRARIAAQTMFMSHETYTPARGGSAQAEVESLRTVFKEKADEIIVANTKGYTGHAMGVGVEEIVLIKALQEQRVPAVANFQEPDPGLGALNLSRGGTYPLSYALKFAAGFGSQLAISLYKRVEHAEIRIVDQKTYTQWLGKISGEKEPQVEIVHNTLRVRSDELQRILSGNGKKQISPRPELTAPSVVPASPAAQPVTAERAAANGISHEIMALVAEKTGYPLEMLELDLDLEADLGIDTVKQAEIFAQIREKYQIPARAELKLRDYPTLNHLIGYVSSMRPELARATTEPTVSAGTPAPASSSGISREIMALVAEKTGYPLEMLELDLDLEADLGIDTVKQAEIFAQIGEKYQIPARADLKLRDYPTLNHLIGYVSSMRPELARATAGPTVSADTPTPASSSGISREIMALVAEKTGYPLEMLELDLDLEADLGIDTVKQAEVFALLRQKYSLPQQENLQLRDYPTLQHLIDYVTRLQPVDTRSNQYVQAPVTVSAPPVVAKPSVATQPDSPIQNEVLQLVAEKTGYPVEMLELDLDLEADLGIDTVKQAEVFAEIRSKYGISLDKDVQLRDYPTLQHLIGFVQQKRQKGPSGPMSPIAPSPVPLVNPKLPALSVADPIATIIIELVSDKTGYPTEMLDLDLDLEADLGIDTVKQAEVFAEIRAKFNLARVDNVQLRDYPTLSHLIEYVKRQSGVTERPSVTPEAQAGPAAATPRAEPEKDQAIKRLVPELVPCPREQSGEAKSKPDLKGVILLTADGENGLWKALAKKLTASGATVVLVHDVPVKKGKNKNLFMVECPLSDLERLRVEIEKVRQDHGPIRGIIHLSGWADGPDMTELTLARWREESARRIKSLFVIVQTCQPDLVSSPEAAFILAPVCMGGSFGFNGYADQTPLTGGVTGLTKALSKELEGVMVKSLDFERNISANKAAELIWTELLTRDNITEISYIRGERQTVQVVPMPLHETGPARLTLDQESVIVITGGVQGITAEIAKDLAQSFKPHLVLLDIVRIPEDIERYAAMNEQQLQNLKDQLKTELSAKHERVTPVMLEREFGLYTRAVTAHRNLEQMRQAGATVSYIQCDVTDESNVAATMARIVEKSGRIDVIIHGAGLEESKSLANKKLDMFEKVFDVKANGCFNLIQQARRFGFKAAIFFASVAGRFGNIGQTDYSAANDLLNKYAAWINANIEGSRALAINWTGWAKVGMATKETIKKLFEEAGIDLIPLDYGRQLVRQELLFCDDRAEVIYAGKLGFLDASQQVVGPERSRESIRIQQTISQNQDHFPLLDQVASAYAGQSVVLTRTLSPARDLFLADHALNEVPLLPGVMGLEIFAEAAQAWYPELRLSGLEQVSFQQALKIFKGNPVELTIEQHLEKSSDNGLLIQSRLKSDFLNTKGVRIGGPRVHFEAQVRLAEQYSPAETGPIVFQEKELSQELTQSEIYAILFHGPRFQVCQDFRLFGAKGCLARMNPDLGEQIQGLNPLWHVQPLLIELGFQAAGLFEYLQTNRFGLPFAIGQLILHGPVPTQIQTAEARVAPLVRPDGSYSFTIQLWLGDTLMASILDYRTVALASLS